MSALSERIAALPPDKRARLEQYLLQQSLAPSRSEPAIARRHAAGAPPLSFAQTRLWLLNQLEPASPAYNMVSARRLTGPLDVPSLEAAFASLIRRHESLRTTFVMVEGEPVQRIAAPWALALPSEDVRGLEADQRQAAVEAALNDATTRPYDLAQGPLMRARLLHTGTEEHILVLSMHHIISDGWSMAVLWRELTAFYRARVEGNEPRLGELPIQYADYAEWQRDWLAGEEAQRELAWWRAKLEGAPALLDLPADRPRPAVQSYHGGRCAVDIPASVTRELNTMGRQAGATLFMVLLAALDVLLYRYTGQEDLVVGTSVAGRNHREIEGLIGCFLNTLALRTHVHAELSFLEVLQRARATALEAFARQELPFERLLDELELGHSLSYTPLAQVMLILQNTPAAELSVPGLAVERLSYERATAKLDLTLTLHEGADGLQGAFEYSADLFESESAARMAGHFVRLLRAIIADPDAPIGDLLYLAPEELADVTQCWNQTGRGYAHQPDLMQQFAAQVAARPAAAAFMAGDAQISYAELDGRANQLARYLAGQGIGRGVRAGLCLERSLEAVAALLALYKLGAIYVPLDPTYPRDRLHYMMADAGVAVVITRRGLADELELGALASRPLVVALDLAQAEIAATDPAPVYTELKADDLAYIIYTSGSTGRPKGIAVPHRQILNRLAWMWEDYPLATNEVGCLKTALSFVDSLWELFGYLLQGVPTVIVPDDDLRDPARLIEALAERGVTRIWLVPALLRTLLDTDAALAARLPKLTFWVVSGEILPCELAARFQAAMPHAVLYNLYGTSEAWDITWYDPRDQRGDAHGACASVPIGRPIANMRTYILDARGQPVPIGVRGELWVGGDGVALGYLNQPELTASVRRRDIFVADPAAVIYRTGDEARFLPDGNIEFLGRRDSQIKLRGYRIELEEIETALNHHPAIRRSTAVLRSFGADDQRIVAYYVARTAAGVTDDALRDHLRRSLPTFMIPAHFVALEQLPLTPSGKIDRRALPAPGRSQEETVAHAPAEDGLELLLLRLWREILGEEGFGIDASFFDLGGHSLLAVRLLARIEEVIGTRVPLAALFQSPTVRTLAQVIRAGDWSSPWQTLVPIQVGGSRTPLYLVPPEAATSVRFVRLAKALGPEQAVFGFNPLGMDGVATAQDSVEAMASLYLAEMRLLQPEGPYLIGGMCFGATVAYEMAQRLVAEGEEVPLLIILDGAPPVVEGEVSRTARLAQLRDRLRWRMRAAPLSEVVADEVRLRLMRARRGLRRQWSRRNAIGAMTERVRACHQTARIQYRARRYGGRMIVYESSQRARDGRTSDWRFLATGELTTYVVPDTSHQRLLLTEHGLHAVAEHLHGVLAEFDAAGGDAAEPGAAGDNGE